MKKIVVMLFLFIGSGTTVALAQKVSLVSSADTCNCIRCIKARIARSMAIARSHVAEKPATTATTTLVEGGYPVIVNGTVTGNITVQVFQRDTPAKAVVTSTEGSSESFLSIRDDEKESAPAPKTPLLPPVYRTAEYEKALKQVGGGRSGKSFAVEDFSTADGAKQRRKRFKKVKVSLGHGMWEAENLLTENQTALSKEIPNLIVTQAGLILITRISSSADLEDDPDEPAYESEEVPGSQKGTWYARFKGGQKAIDAYASNVRIFWAKN